MYGICKRLALLLALFACTGCVWKRGTAEKPVLTAVEFDGNKRIKDKELAAAIRTSATGKLPFSEAQKLDGDVVRSDLERVLRYYRARGYYGTEIEGWRLARSSKGKARLSIILKEGKPTRIRRFVVEGIDGLEDDDRRYVLEELPLHDGTLLDEANYDLTKKILEERLRIVGYAKAEVDGKVYVEQGASEGGFHSEVIYTAEPGEKYRLGEITVQGNGSISKKPILLAARLEPGQTFSSRRMDEAQGNVYDLGVFRAVAIETGEPLEGNILPVTIGVREAPLQAFETGVGGGIDQQSQRVRTRVTWRHKDLLGGLELIETTIRGGYAVLPNIVEPEHDGPIWGAEAKFRRPNFLNRNVVLTSRLDYDHAIQEAYDEDSARGSVGIERHIWEIGLGAAYGLHVYRLSDFRTVTGPAGTSSKLSPDRCPTPCTISFFEPRVWWDHRDDPVEPRRGWYAALALEQGGGILGGTHDYSRANPELRVYMTPRLAQNRTTFAGRVETGWMLPENGASPVVRRFYSGGPDSHRGYATRRLSPMVNQRGGGEVPIGGDNLFEASLETRVWATDKLIGVAWIDAGAVENTRKTLDPNRMAIASGPGLRYITPIGPVRLDVGYRFKEPVIRTLDVPRDRVRDPKWTFHVGLGEAF